MDNSISFLTKGYLIAKTLIRLDWEKAAHRSLLALANTLSSHMSYFLYKSLITPQVNILRKYV